LATVTVTELAGSRSRGIGDLAEIVNGRLWHGNKFSAGDDVAKSIKTECTVEIDDVLVVNRSGHSVEGWCSGCNSETTLVTPEDAANIAGIGARFVYRLIEVGEVHSQEGPGDVLLLCLGSLLEMLGENFRGPTKE